MISAFRFEDRRKTSEKKEKDASERTWLCASAFVSAPFVNEFYCSPLPETEFSSCSTGNYRTHLASEACWTEYKQILDKGQVPARDIFKTVFGVGFIYENIRYSFTATRSSMHIWTLYLNGGDGSNEDVYAPGCVGRRHPTIDQATRVSLAPGDILGILTLDDPTRFKRAKPFEGLLPPVGAPRIVGNKPHQCTAIMGDTGIGSVYCPISFNSYGHMSHAPIRTKIFVGHSVTKGILALAELAEVNREMPADQTAKLGHHTKVFAAGRAECGEAARRNRRGYWVTQRGYKREFSQGVGTSEARPADADDLCKTNSFTPSQENPLQTGTGLGLAIVNSIVKSEGIKGKYVHGAGDDEATAPEMEPFKFDDPVHPVSVSLVDFEDEHKGVQLLHNVLQTSLVLWWGFQVRPSAQLYGEIVILNEDVEPVKRATAERSTSRPFIILSTCWKIGHKWQSARSPSSISHNDRHRTPTNYVEHSR
ncbi:hypothetical protein C8R45DRAFT_1156044 [Mycena sanguinolenta]|nr:hypothetical protein C8R45DRAFT_1156044 [Mycena sanguinolenta]